MILHTAFGETKMGRANLRALIRQGQITLGGNNRLKIYGTLQCKSGKRMKRENRVFFKSEAEAITKGFRPCGHCMKAKYLSWRANANSLLNNGSSPFQGGATGK